MRHNIINTILLIVVLLIIFIIKKKNKKQSYHGEIYYKFKRINITLYILSAIIFFAVLVVEVLSKQYTNTPNDIFYLIMNSLTIALITMPISMTKLYDTSFKDEEKISHTKTIITNIVDSKYIKKFNDAGIKLLILTDKKTNLKIKTIKEEEFDKKLLNRNLIVQTSNPDFIKKVRIKNSYSEYKNLENAYDKIYKARGVHDNFIRTIRYNITSYLPLALLALTNYITSFDHNYNIRLLLLFKLATTILNEYVYKNMHYDTDLMNRKPKENNVLLGSQELLFDFIESFVIFALISIPYMHILTFDGGVRLASGVFYITFIYSNIFLTISYYSEKPLIYNLFHIIKDLRLDIYLIVFVVMSILINFIYELGATNIGLQNYTFGFVVGFISVLFIEIVKLARFLTVKGRKKHELKNNKKH